VIFEDITAAPGAGGKVSNDAAAICAYMIHGKNGHPLPTRVRDQFCLNCESTADDAELSAYEMDLTASRNTRTRIQKFKHLVVSLHEGEHLSKAQWTDVAKRVLKTLGMPEHQCACVVHGDTGNEHLHLCVNTIHPRTYRKINRKFVWLDEAREMEKLEDRYGFRHDNERITQKQIAPDQNHDDHIKALIGAAERRRLEKERHIRTQTGNMSLSEMLNLHRSEFMRCATWEDLHSLCAALGCRIAERGSGFVIVAEDAKTKKNGVKLSAVGIRNAVKKFGAFTPPHAPAPAPAPEFKLASLRFEDLKTDPEKDRRLAQIRALVFRLRPQAERWQRSFIDKPPIICFKDHSDQLAAAEIAAQSGIKGLFFASSSAQLFYEMRSRDYERLKLHLKAEFEAFQRREELAKSLTGTSASKDDESQKAAKAAMPERPVYRSATVLAPIETAKPGFDGGEDPDADLEEELSADRRRQKNGTSPQKVHPAVKRHGRR